MNDIWVCEACRSINRLRDDLCYHCGAPRSGAMATPGLDLRAESAARERSGRAYVISWPLALITAVLLMAVALLGIVILRLQAADYPALRQAFVDALTSGSATVDEALAAQSAHIALASLVRFGLTLVALVCFAGWLALVTRNVPLLGGGTPSRSPARVFVYALIPVWNLIKVPGMLQDLLYRVDPEGGGAFMVLAAWIGLVGSYLVSLVGGWVITWAGVRALVPQLAAGDMGAVVKTFSDVLDQSYWLGVVVALMVAGGTVLLAAIMLRVESRCAARDREILAQLQASGAPVPPAGPDWGAQPAPNMATVAAAPPAPAAPPDTWAPPGGAAAPMPIAPPDPPPAPDPAADATPPPIAPPAQPAPPAQQAPGPYEPNWPASRGWPGTRSQPAPPPPSADGAGDPPPSPPDAPRLG